MLTLALRGPPAPVTGVVSGMSTVAFTETIVFFTLALISVILRIWARCLRRMSLGKEDYLIFLALFVYAGHATMGILQVLYGGLGNRTISEDNVVFAAKMQVATSISYAVIMTLSKCSILFLYIRLFAVRRFRISAIVVLGFTIVWGILAVLSNWVLCSPVAYSWDRSISGGHCGDTYSLLLTVGVFDVVDDIAIFVLPIKMIKGLQITQTEKRLLYGLFGVGLISIVTSAIRVTTFIESKTFNDTWAMGPLAIWTQLEPGISIFVSCALVLRPVLQKLLPRRFFPSQHTTPQVTDLGGTDHKHMRSYGTGSFGLGVADNKDLYDMSTIELNSPTGPRPSIAREPNVWHGVPANRNAWSQEREVRIEASKEKQKEKSKTKDSPRSSSRLGRERDRSGALTPSRPSSRLGRKLSSRARDYWDEDEPHRPSMTELGGITVQTEIVVGTTR